MIQMLTEKATLLTMIIIGFAGSVIWISTKCFSGWSLVMASTKYLVTNLSSLLPVDY